MSAYTAIQPLALRLRTGGELCQQYMLLRVPHAWARSLANLARRGFGEERSTVPVRSLNAAVRMLLPDITGVQPWREVTDGRPWLLGLTAVDPRAVLSIIRAWAYSDFGNASPEARRAALEAFEGADLEWEAETIDLARWRRSANGTAEPEDKSTWSLLPLVIAQRLSQAGFTDHDGTRREWARCYSESGAEVVSWPPFGVERHRRPTHYYSLTARITAQTRPFDPDPLIHLHFGIRRWVSAVPERGLYLRQPVTVHMRASATWLPEAPSTRAFQAGKLEWSRGEARWADQISELLRHLTLASPIPTPQQLLGDPASYLLGADALGITYQHGMSPSHRVAPGLNPVDRARLFEQAADALTGWAAVVDEAPRVRARSVLPRQRARPARAGGDPVRARIAATVGPRLRLEVYQQDSGLKDAVASAVCALLGTPQSKVRDLWRWRDPGFELELVTRPFPTWLGQLEVPNRKLGALRAAIAGRRREIVEQLGRSTEIALALVELPGAEVFKSGDPKLADRVGLAAAGRLSQFLVPGDDALSERVGAALADLLLRQTGVAPAALAGGRPAPALAGIWVVRSNANRFAGRSAVCLPFAVRLLPGSGRIEAATLEPSGRLTGWVAYSDALLKAAEFTVGRSYVEGDKVEAFLSGVVRSMPEGAVVLTAAQNLRQFVPSLRDTVLEGRLPGAGPGVAHVRVRTADQYESAQYFARAGENISVATGVWRFGDCVFASTGDKPASQRNWRPTLSKLARPTAGSWNPRILEVAVARPAGRRPEDLALVVHQLRWAAPHHPEALGLPMPLHLARLAEEYALGTPPDEERHPDGTGIVSD